MNEQAEPLGTKAKVGCALSFAIAVVTIMVVTIAFSLVTGHPVNLKEEWGVLLFQMILVAVPFGLLSLGRIYRTLPWLVGLALTAAFWGFELFDGIRYQLRGDTSGVNIVLAFAMLLSPVVITAVCFVVARVDSRRG